MGINVLFVFMFLLILSCYFIRLCYYTYWIKKNISHIISFLTRVYNSEMLYVPRAEAIPYYEGVR